MPFVVKRFAGARYTGTQESAEEALAQVRAILTTGSVWSIASADAAQLTLHESADWGEFDYSVPVDWWFVFAGIGVINVLTDEMFNIEFQTIDSLGQQP